MTLANTSDYWFSSTAIYISLNAAGDPNYIAANASSNSAILVYMKGIGGLGYDAGHNYQRWKIVAGPTVFQAREKEYYVYIRIPRNPAAADTSAEVVFPSAQIDIYGKTASGSQLGSPDYWYIWTRGIISAASATNGREWKQHMDGGTLSTDAALQDTGGGGDWWQWNVGQETLQFIKTITKAAFEYLSASVIKVEQLIIGSYIINGIASDSTPVTSDNHIATPLYVDNHALSKAHDDKTDFDLTIGGKLAVEKDVDVKGKVEGREFIEDNGSTFENLDIEGDTGEIEPSADPDAKIKQATWGKMKNVSGNVDNASRGNYALTVNRNGEYDIAPMQDVLKDMNIGGGGAVVCTMDEYEDMPSHSPNTFYKIEVRGVVHRIYLGDFLLGRKAKGDEEVSQGFPYTFPIIFA